MYFKVSTLLLLFEVILDVQAWQLQKRVKSSRVLDVKFSKYHGALYVNDAYRTSAVLFNDNMMLTTAHRVADEVKMSSSQVRAHVILGASVRDDGTKYLVKRISHHRGFRKLSNYIIQDNIAVVHLAKNVTITNYIRPLRLLPEYLELPDIIKIHVTAFSKPYYRNTSKLHRIDMYTAMLSLCQQRYPHGELKDTHLCSFLPNDIDPDLDTEGAPVHAYRQKFIVGIVSVDNTESNRREPIIVTKISSYWEYIQSEIDYYKVRPEERNSNHPAIEFDN